MLVTDETWVECDPIRRALAQPYQAWRCFAWTDERLNFLVVASRNRPDDAELPDGWFVGGVEALLEAVSQMEPGSFSVHVLDRSAGDTGASLSQVTGIWRERELKGGIPRFWYGTQAGKFKPCWRARIDPDAELDLVSVQGFEGRLGA